MSQQRLSEDEDIDIVGGRNEQCFRPKPIFAALSEPQLAPSVGPDREEKPIDAPSGPETKHLTHEDGDGSAEHAKSPVSAALPVDNLTASAPVDLKAATAAATATTETTIVPLPQPTTTDPVPVAEFAAAEAGATARAALPSNAEEQSPTAVVRPSSPSTTPVRSTPPALDLPPPPPTATTTSLLPLHTKNNHGDVLQAWLNQRAVDPHPSESEDKQAFDALETMNSSDSDNNDDDDDDDEETLNENISEETPLHYQPTSSEVAADAACDALRNLLPSLQGNREVISSATAVMLSAGMHGATARAVRMVLEACTNALKPKDRLPYLYLLDSTLKRDSKDSMKLGATVTSTTTTTSTTRCWGFSRAIGAALIHLIHLLLGDDDVCAKTEKILGIWQQEKLIPDALLHPGLEAVRADRDGRGNKPSLVVCPEDRKNEMLAAWRGMPLNAGMTLIYEMEDGGEVRYCLPSKEKAPPFDWRTPEEVGIEVKVKVKERQGVQGEEKPQPRNRGNALSPHIPPDVSPWRRQWYGMKLDGTFSPAAAFAADGHRGQKAKEKESTRIVELEEGEYVALPPPRPPPRRHRDAAAEPPAHRA